MNTPIQAAAAHPFRVPVLVTQRLAVRPLALQDLETCHRLFAEIGWNDPALPAAEALARRETWLRWTIAGYDELARLFQPPLGERAVTDRVTGAFLGLVGYVPSFAPFGRLPSFGGRTDAGGTMELGLFWALSPAAQGRGYATEAAGALIDHAFRVLGAGRIVATTEHANAASIAVMRRLGMRIERDHGGHPGLQVVGRLDADLLLDVQGAAMPKPSA